MERIDQFQFYQLGANVRALLEKQDGVPAHDAFFILLNVRTSLASLMAGEPMPLSVSRGPAKELIDALNELFNQYFTVPGSSPPEIAYPGPDAPSLQSWQWGWLEALTKRFETVFREELRDAAVYFVPRRGIFHTPSLIDSADEAFPQSIIEYIPQKTRDDWKAAGRCLAFNLFSASGFHVARAVEGVIEAYYQTMSSKPGKTLNSWNDYLKALQSLSDDMDSHPQPTAKTIAEIQQMKDDYRNPIMHPRQVLSEPDARMLFANGESLILAMAQEISQAAALENANQ